MTIRLTTVDNFSRLMRLITRNPFYTEEPNKQFMQSTVQIIKHRMEDGEECYLDMFYKTIDDRVCLILTYHTLQDIQTDIEYVTINAK